jgi:hypothetical protein
MEEALAIIVIYAIVVGVAYRWRDRPVSGTTASLCLTCTSAVITRGTGGQELIGCTYAGPIRPVKFTVCECTGYCSTRVTSNVVRIEGFVKEEDEVYERIAIS